MIQLRATVGTLAALLSLAVTDDAFAVQFKLGLWNTSGYLDSNGKRIPCHGGFCGQLSTTPDLDPRLVAEMAERQKKLDQVCISTDVLQGFAVQQLAQRALVIESANKNCKPSEPVTSETGRETGLMCDGLNLTQKISYPDDKHLTYTTTVTAVVATGSEPSYTTMVTNYEWADADCGDVDNVIRAVPHVKP